MNFCSSRAALSLLALPLALILLLAACSPASEPTPAPESTPVTDGESTGGDKQTASPDDQTSAVTDPPATDPAITDPPATDPPATDPVVTDPPTTSAPVTDPIETEPPHRHTFDRQIEDKAYFAAEATHASGKRYYYSCACGEKGTKTFAVGEPEPHVWGDWATVRPSDCAVAGKEERRCACGETEERALPLTEHEHKESTVPPTCSGEGYTLHTCVCGNSYRTDTVPATGKHVFEQAQLTRPDGAGETIYYTGTVCRDCRMEVLAYGNADGSWGREAACKFYVTGHGNRMSFEAAEKIVIYGSGNMPGFAPNNSPPWQDYLPYVKEIVIENGITSISPYAFRCTDRTTRVQITMADSVTFIGECGLKLPMRALSMSKSLKKIDFSALGSIQGQLYLPATLTHMVEIPYGVDVFYGGTYEQLMQIRVHQPIAETSLGEYFAGLDEGQLSNYWYFLEASGLGDRHKPWR